MRRLKREDQKISCSSSSYLPSTYSYLANQDEVGFYIVCNDKTILDMIHSAFKNRGLVSIVDTAGRLHYLVDGSQGGYPAIHSISNVVLHLQEQMGENSLDVYPVIESLFKKYSLDKGLMGTKLLKFLLLESLKDPSLLTAVSKRLYPLAAEEFQISANQVERNLRYTLTRTTMHQDGKRNVHIIQALYDEMILQLSDQQFQKTSPLPF